MAALGATAGLSPACGGAARAPSADAGEDQATALDGTTSDAPAASDAAEDSIAEGSISDGSTAEASIADSAPSPQLDAAVEADAGVAQPAIYAGAVDTCVLRSGVLECWGDNTFGELGDGTQGPDDAPHPMPGTVHFASPTVAGAGGGFGCASDGSRTACWGYNRYDALGHDRALDFGDAGDAGRCPGFACSLAPEEVAGLANVTSFGLGSTFACAVLADRSVSCWGANAYDELGFVSGVGGARCDTYPCYPTPAPVGIAEVSSLSAGGSFVCARKTDGSAWCWGGDTEGELGPGTSDAGLDASPVVGFSQPTPAMVLGPGSTLALGAGRDFACAVLADSTVTCWGDNYYGELGRTPTPFSMGVFVSYSPVPSAIPALTGARELALGDGFACALKNDDTVACWGTNRQGQLGHDPATDTEKDLYGLAIRTTPTTVAGVSHVLHIAAGLDYVCALEKNDTVWCWGDNTYGELGIAPDPDAGAPQSFAPVEVVGL